MFRVRTGRSAESRWLEIRVEPKSGKVLLSILFGLCENSYGSEWKPMLSGFEFLEDEV